ncbi:MAG: S8 family serine peptidase [bacterium]
MDIWSGDGNQATTGTLIAIIDDGLRYTHPDFNGQLRDGGSCVDPMGDILGNCIFGYDAVAGDKDPQSYGNDTHGTHVAGIIGAKTNNGI